MRFLRVKGKFKYFSILLALAKFKILGIIKASMFGVHNRDSNKTSFFLGGGVASYFYYLPTS